MAFWTAQRLRAKLQPGLIITPYDPDRVKYGAYELGLGGETIITPANWWHGTKFSKANEKIVIPAGQMAMLITEEQVNIPLSAMAFISMKAGKKLGGLINISGFHVDPGFHGKLKFSVYNAGSRDAVLAVGQPTFPIWFCDLDDKTDTPYNGEHQHQVRLTAEDASRLRGEVASPQALSGKIRSLQRQMKIVYAGLGVIIMVIVTALLKKFLGL